MTRIASGQRRHLARIEQHDGTTVDGQPTYHDDAHWSTFIRALPISFQGVVGGEVIRGQQMTAEAKALVQCLSTPRTRRINTRMRMVINDKIYHIATITPRYEWRDELSIQVKEVE